MLPRKSSSLNKRRSFLISVKGREEKCLLKLGRKEEIADVIENDSMSRIVYIELHLLLTQKNAFWINYQRKTNVGT